MNRIGLILLLSAWAASASAQPLEQLFREGTSAAQSGDYSSAERAYLRILEAGVHDPDVEFNLGIAYGGQSQYGRALAHFERARRLDPGAEAPRLAADEARRLIAERRADQEGSAEVDAGGGFVDSLYSGFTESALAVTTAIATLLMFLFLIVRSRASGSLKIGSALIATVGCLVAFFAGAGTLEKRGVFRAGQDAIIVQDQVALRDGPDPRARERGIAREGDFATVINSDGEFVHVRTRNGEGWVPASGAVLLEASVD